MLLNTKSMRTLIEKYKRLLLLGLVVFLIVVFTVTGAITDAFSERGTDAPPADEDVAGSFRLNPKDETKISYARYNRARTAVRTWNFLTRGGGQTTSDLDVWVHLILVETGREQGIVVNDAELVRTLRSNRNLAPIMADKTRYTKFCRERNLTRKQFEESFRDGMVAARVRTLYQDTYQIAPPATRVDLVKIFAPGRFEFVDATWAALDASLFLEEEARNLNDAEDSSKLLKDFFAKDPAVKEEATQFRRKRRFQFEMLYANHERLTEENLEIAKKMFFAAWPEFGETEETRKKALDFGGEDQIRSFWTSYQSRLIKAEGKTLDQLRAKATTQVDKELEATKKDTDTPKKDDDPKDDSKTDNPDEKTPDDTLAEQDLAELARRKQIDEALETIGKQICRDRIIRELELRHMYRRIHVDAYNNPKESLRKIYDRLLAVDDENAPLCSTVPNKGLFVLLQPKEALSMNEIGDLKDGEHTFGPNVAFRVSGATREKLSLV